MRKDFRKAMYNNPFISLTPEGGGVGDITIVNWKNISHMRQYNEISGSRNVPKLEINFLAGNQVTLSGPSCSEFLGALQSIGSTEKVNTGSGAAGR